MAFDLVSWLKNQAGNEALDVPLVDVAGLDAGDRREWLVTNGLGTFASGTITGATMRKYHGLLVAATEPPAGRRVLLSRIDDDVNGIALHTNYWSADYVAPHGYEKLESFSIYPVPTWCYRVPGGVLVKQVAMVHGEQQTVIGYTWLPDADGDQPTRHASLRLRLLVNDRDFHGETHGNADWRFVQTRLGEAAVATCAPGQGGGRIGFKANADARHELVVAFDRGDYTEAPSWYHNYYLPMEFERGLGTREDMFHAGQVVVDLAPGETVSLNAGVTREGAVAVRTIGDAVRLVVARQQELIAAAGVSETDTTRRRLALAADAFVVRRDSTKSDTIIAGYHWFNDWGRDSMISLPGLCLSTGRTDVARGILTTFAAYLSNGMLPNNFPDVGATPEYNTADATFWWAWALLKYHDATGDTEFVRGMIPLLESVVDWHIKGTRYNIHLDETDGLIAASADGVQLTWMDALCEGFVVTPRRGKPVEINALWFNFLKVLEVLHQRLGSDGTKYGDLAEKTRQGFDAFWNADRGCLYDVLSAADSKESPDASVRCNQVFAVSLPYSPLSAERAAAVLAVVERDLLTPYGLRTLSPDDPQYQGVYGRGLTSANQYNRDLTYHQGTVWPWPIGSWVDARVRVHGRTAENFAFIRKALQPLIEHMSNAAGLGSVSEIFDGNAPHAPRGCVAQAWSLAELLRVLTDYPELAASTSTETSTTS